MTAKVSKSNDEHKSVFGNSRKNDRSSEGGANWSNADSATLGGLIDAVTSRGGAIRIGYTRDSGAYAIGLYYGSESNTAYCRPSESLDDFLKEWTEFYLNLPYSGGVSPSK